MQRKVNWKSGLSEVISFTMIVPCIVLLICAILSAYLIGTSNQQLLYAAYSVGRAAVVCENESLAQNRADAIMEELYGANFISGTPDENGEATYSIEILGTDEWQKGTLIRCTVNQYITPVLPFTTKVYSKTIVMMVENGEGSITTDGG